MKLPFEENSKKIISRVEMEEKPFPPRSVEQLLQKGMIIVDKPPGPTSHQAVDYLKRILELKKAGHSGTLDPGVTGVLPVALSNATRITNALLGAGKEYVCLIHLHDDVSDEKLEEVLQKFRGKIKQLPPKKSAVKRRLRERTIYYLQLLDRIEKEVLVLVGCEAGTYIRKLAHDIGLELGCGAHMAELRRTKAGPFIEEKSYTLQDITDAYHYYKQGDESQLKKMLLPIEFGVRHLKKIWVQDGALKSLTHGAYLKVPGVIKFNSDINVGDTVAVMSTSNELVLIGKAHMNSQDLEVANKGVAVNTSQVFMDPQ